MLLEVCAMTFWTPEFHLSVAKKAGRVKQSKRK
jgi:hypothetical protein